MSEQMWKIITMAAALSASATAALGQTDIFFEGDLSSMCQLSLPTNGSLGLDSSGRLSSELLGFGSITIFTTGGNHLHITVPAWDSSGAPAGYTPGGETFELRYFGLAGLGLADSGWSQAEADVTLPALPISILKLDARVSSPGGWVDGTYRMKVTVTCAST